MKSVNERPILALDVDGVVIDGWPNYRWNENLEADLGIKTSDYQEMIHGPLWHDIVRGQISLKPVLEDFLRGVRSQITPGEFMDYWFRNDGRLADEVIKVAIAWKERRGGLLYLATNQEPLRAKFIWEGLKLKHCFDGMIVSCQIGAAKPEPEYFQRADEVIDRASGQQVIFLDDMIANVKSARAHGWTAHHVENIPHAVEILEGL